MTFSRVKPASWSFGEILTSAQQNALDIDHAAAVDGGAGGDYAPTGTIYWKGKGISVGKAIGDDTSFSTANAKWAGAAADFSGGPTIALKLVDLCAFDESKFLAVAAVASDKIALSLDDGFSWRDISSNIASPQTILLGCCAAKGPEGSGSLMLAAGNSAKFYNSSDAVSWTFGTMPGSPTNIGRMHYHAGLDLFIAIGNTASGPYICSITSSLVPTSRTVPASITGVQSGLSIAQARAGANSGRLVATWGSQTKVAYSDDGVTWTASTTSLTSHNYAVAWGDGVFVALDRGASSTAYVSTDGSTWTTSGVTKPTSSLLQSFTCLNGIFAALDSTNQIYMSSDKGATWHFLSVQYLGYNTGGSLRAVTSRLHSLQTDGTNAVNMRSRRVGFSDGSG